ncbi:MAG: mannose-1-phosphate guanyltransferase, partial [Akkermansiaceae bacterium]|nr:mannose-1-phosphate guanyltransferase [Akkermansiaceae bacterium]
VAEQYLASGNFAWNAGVFIWSVPTVLNELKTHTPELGSFVEEIRDSNDPGKTVAAR